MAQAPMAQAKATIEPRKDKTVEAPMTAVHRQPLDHIEAWLTRSSRRTLGQLGDLGYGGFPVSAWSFAISRRNLARNRQRGGLNSCQARLFS
jgi:hypothetical protein